MPRPTVGRLPRFRSYSCAPHRISPELRVRRDAAPAVIGGRGGAAGADVTQDALEQFRRQKFIAGFWLMWGFGQLVQERGELVEPRRDGLGAWARRVSAAHGGALVRLGLVVGRSDLKGVAVSNAA